MCLLFIPPFCVSFLSFFCPLFINYVLFPDSILTYTSSENMNFIIFV